MVCRRVCLPEHDLTLQLVSGVHSGEEAIQFYRALDAGCATRWLSYFGPTADMSKIDVASVPLLKRVLTEKQKELFGDKPKPHAIVCLSESSRQYFFDFWKPYFTHGDESVVRSFRSLEEAYDWFGLSDEARAAVAGAIEGRDAAEPEVGRYAPPPDRAAAAARFQRRE
jgi:hypothetical protein